jgi:hypothetical protein
VTPTDLEPSSPTVTKMCIAPNKKSHNLYPARESCGTSWRANPVPSNKINKSGGADFGERTEGGRIEIKSECFVVSIEFLRGKA